MAHGGNSAIMEKKGLIFVEEIVTQKMRSLWQKYDGNNDEGLDGLILFKKKDRDTGALLHVQVKCGESYKKNIKKYPNYICINLGIDLKKHKSKWAIKDAPVILVYVSQDADDKTKAWWTNLKSETSYSESNKSIVLIPKNQVFQHHSKGELIYLTGVKSLKYELPQIEMFRDEVSNFNLSQSLKKQAREYYREWAKEELSERHNPTLGEIVINRVGWRHITRRGRHAERIMQSWLLLSVAKKMILNATEFHRLGAAKVKNYAPGEYDFKENRSACIRVVDYIGLRARVVFPHRDEALVQVVLRRKRVQSIENPENIYSIIHFYSVYEKRKKHG